MTRIIHDQAAGLRSLASFQMNDSVRVITVAGGKKGIGKTYVALNLATALAKDSKRVLLIDENPCQNNICTTLGLKARFDLLHVINKDKTLDQVLVRGPENISILSAMRGIHALTKLDANEQDWLIKSIAQLTESVDVVLVDTAMGGTTHVLPLSLASEQVLIVLSGSASSLTGAYALMKIMSQEYARKRFLILVNRADSKPDAMAIFDNLSKVVSQYLCVSLEYVGYVPNEEQLRYVTQFYRPIVDAYPASHAAICFRQLAENILHSSCPDDYSGGIEHFMQRLIHTSHLSMTNFTA
jgi:flagellar biosynthesis protein FlhG